MRLVVILCLSYLLVACGGASGGKDSSAVSSGANNTSEYTIIEGSDENEIITVSFTPTRTGQFNYETVNVGAVAKSDYIAINGSINAVAGTTYELTVELLSDTRVEDDERFDLRITDEAGSEWLNISIFIINDDFPEFSVTAIDTTEGDVGTGKVQFEITLAESSIANFPLTIKTLDIERVGFGLAGEDYTSYSNNIIFMAGELNKVIEIETFADLDIELDEVIQLQIQHLNNPAITSEAVIRTDDFPGQGAPTFIVNQGRSLQSIENSEGQIFQMPFSMNDTGGFTEAFTLSYKLREVDADIINDSDNELAELGHDFDENLKQIQIIPGVFEYSANFTINDDSNLELTEVLELVLFNDAGVEFGSGRIYVSDNEAPEFNVFRKYTDEQGNEMVSNELRYVEGSDAIGAHKVMIELVGSAGYDFQFNYVMRLANASESNLSVDENDFIQAIAGETIQGKTLTVLKGSRLPDGIEQDGIPFTIQDDVTIEGNESFFLELMNVNGTPIGQPIEIKILNDDIPQIRWVNNSPQLPATSSQPFLFSEGATTSLQVELVESKGNQVALENFAIETSKVAVSLPVCSWRNDNQLQESDLKLNFENIRQLDAGEAFLDYEFEITDDSEVECDEIMGLRATITSLNEGVFDQWSDEIILTVENSDAAKVDVYGFSQNESIPGASFKVVLDSDIQLEAEFTLISVSAEVSDASFEFEGSEVVPSFVNVMALGFDGSRVDQEKIISVDINDDQIVELDEKYEFKLQLINDSASSDFPVELRQCTQSGLNNTVVVCTVIADTATAATVNGEIVNDDLLKLTLTPKSTESVNENALTLLSVTNLDISKPYRYQLSHQISSDVGEIKVLAIDRCILEPSNDCAAADDFIFGDTIIHDGVNDTLLLSRDVNLTLLSEDDLVEPDEMIKINLLLDHSSAGSSLVADWQNDEIKHSIIDNDKLTITVENKMVGAIVEDDLNAETLTDVYIKWDKGIAENVTDINMSLTEVCDETLDDSCFVTAASTDAASMIRITGDIAFNRFFSIHSLGSVTASNVSGSRLGITVMGDDRVEPDEQGSVRIGVHELSSVSSYLVDPEWTEQEVMLMIENDDLLNIAINTSSASMREGAEGDFTEVDLQLSWDKVIAANVPSITFELKEVCDNSVNNHCVSDTHSRDVVFTNASLLAHFNGSETAIQTSWDVGISIVGDALVEPNEVAEIEFSLLNTAILQPYFQSTWNTQTRIFTINNDDVITPRLTFRDDSDAASGSEDTDKDLSAGNDVGLVMTWGMVAIADNADDLIFEVLDSCENCGVGDSDYSVNVADFNLLTESANGQKDFPFTITTDLKVEPDEVVTVKLLRKNTVPDHYFSTTLINHEISELTYTIENDDRLLVSVARADGLATENIAETTAQPLNYKWSGHASDNLPSLYIEHHEICDNNTDTTLPKCLSTTTQLNNSPADISIAASSEINAANNELDASLIAAMGALSINQNDDDWVEIDETLNMSLTIPADLQSYLRFEQTGTDNSNPSFSISKQYLLEDDDVLAITIADPSTANAVSDESESTFIRYPLVLSAFVEQDVIAISLNYIEGNTPTENYASRSLLYADVSDYRVFLGTQAEVDFIVSDVPIKNLGEPLEVASLDLIIAVGDDDIIEPDEAVAFSLSENHAQVNLFDSGTEILPGNATTERSFDILLEDKLQPGIYFSNTLSGAEVLSMSEGDSNNTIAAILSGLNEIDANVGDLTIAIEITCKDTVPLTCDDSELLSPASVVLDYTDVDDSSIISLGLVIEADNIVEPDETVIITLSAPTNAQYFDFPATYRREFTLLNDDYLTFQMMTNGVNLQEGDTGDASTNITLSMADDGEGVEGLTSIAYSISSGITGLDEAEEYGANKDFDFNGSVGTRSLDLTSMIAPSTATLNHTLATINADNVIEANESLLINLNVSVPEDYVSSAVPLSLSEQYLILDDDLLTVIVSGGLMQKEDSGQVAILVCDSLGEGVESAFDLNIKTSAVILDATNNEYLATEKIALLDSDFSLVSESVSVSINDFNNANTYLGHDCSVKNIPIDFTQDTNIEADEWLSFDVSANASYLCNGVGGQCLATNVVIVNDDYTGVLDTGVTECITADGSLTATVEDACLDLTIQDVEVDTLENQYTYINSNGIPLPGRQVAEEELPALNYACLSDNYTGALWSIVRLPSDGTHSTDGKSWLGSIVADTSGLNSLLIANDYCAQSGISSTWKIPTVEQLVGIVNYSELISDSGFVSGFFQNEELLGQYKYWTSSDCDTDNDGTTLEYWVVDMETGTTHCAAETDSHLIRAIYQ